MKKQFWVATIIPVIDSSLDLRFRPDYESWQNLKLIKNLFSFFKITFMYNLQKIKGNIRP